MQLFRGFAREVASALAPLGFVRDPGQLLACPMSGQTSAVLGLNKAIEADHVEVNPTMRLRHATIESLIDEALQLPELARYAMTMAASLGYLMPDPRYRPLLIRNEREVKQAANNLAIDVERYGLPFMRNHNELAAIAQAVQSPPFNAEHRRIYALLRGVLSPRRLLRGAGTPGGAPEIASKTTPQQKQYRQFARALLPRLGASPQSRHA